MQASKYLLLSVAGFIISAALFFLIYITGFQNNLIQTISLALMLCSSYLVFLFIQKKQKLRN